MEAGTPNRAIQPAMKASAQAVAVVEYSGKTSAQRVDRSMYGRHVGVAARAERQRAHQVSMNMGESSGWLWYRVNCCSKLSSDFGPLAGCALSVPSPASAAIPLHTKRAANSRLFALMPGVPVSGQLETLFVHRRGTSGHQRPLEVSQQMVMSPTGKSSSRREDLLRSWVTLVQDCWDLAISSRSTPLAEAEATRREEAPVVPPTTWEAGRQPATRRALLRWQPWLTQD